MKPYVKNAGDQEQVNEAEKKIKFNREDELSDLRKILETGYGRRFLWRLMSHCRAYASVCDVNSPHMTYYHSGRQDVGHFLMAEITNADKLSFIKMIQENDQQ